MKNKTIRPVTIKQLRDGWANKDPSEEDIRVSGQDLHQMYLVGKIVSAQESSTAHHMVEDDGTGKAPVKFWIDDDNVDGGDIPAPHGARARAEWKEGAYVKVSGIVRDMQGKQFIVAYTVKLITNMNEVTLHQLETIYVHLKTVTGGQGPIQLTPGQKRVMGPNPAMQNQMPNQNAAPTAYNNNDGSGVGGMMSPCQRAMFDELHGSAAMANDKGLSFDQLASKLNNQFTEPELREAVNYLQTEGHVYTTVDENHFKGTGA